jgi:APA family basic amino acid/polyamine antiporter
MNQPEHRDGEVKAQIGVFDAVNIIIGIVIGSSVFVTPAIINGHLSGPAAVMGIWAVGGVLSLLGALCYAELATAYPRMGGDYVYLTRAYGSPVGFLFGWANLAVILPSSIGMMSFVFGTYAIKVFGDRFGITQESQAIWTVGFALAAVGLFSLLNVVGVVLGKWTQNILTVAKLIGLGAIAVTGFLLAPSPDAWQVTRPPTDAMPSLGTALILVLYAYGGWNDAAFVASEMRDRRKIPATLILGTLSVMVIYLLINAAYIQGLGFEKTRGFQPIAANVLERTQSPMAGQIISVLVMVSALGAINGMLFTGARVCSALGKDHSIFAKLGRWHPQLRSPVWAVSALAIVSVAMILGVGTQMGRDVIDRCLTAIRLPALPWEKYFGGFDTLFAGTAPVFWSFFLLAGLSVFVLRWREPEVERPFRVPLYPLVPLAFCGMCGFGLYSSLVYANWLALLGVVPLAVGLPLFLFSRHTASDASLAARSRGAETVPQEVS